MIHRLWVKWDLSSIRGLSKRDMIILGESFEEEVGIISDNYLGLPKGVSSEKALVVLEKVLRKIESFDEVIEVESISLIPGRVTFRCQNKMGMKILIRFDPSAITHGSNRIHVIDSFGIKVADYTIEESFTEMLRIEVSEMPYDSNSNYTKHLYNLAYGKRGSEMEGFIDREEDIFYRIEHLNEIRAELLANEKRETPDEKDKSL